MAYAFSSVAYLLANLKSIDNKQDVLIKGIPIIHSFINPYMDIRTRYDFRRHHYLKSKIALSLLSLINTLCLDTSCSVILYDITFFYT